jgi:tryptophan-rich sensory protein
MASVLAAAVVGARNGPQRPSTALWYALLRKPAYTPPGPAVGVAWTLLEGLLALIGYRLMRASPQAGRSQARALALGGWLGTLAGLAGYPWLFFTRRRLGASAAASGAMLASAVIMTTGARRLDRTAAVLAVPLIAWLGFANILGDQLWLANRRSSRD